MLFRETVDEILRIQTDGLPIVSLYLDTRPAAGSSRPRPSTRINSLLKSVRELADSDELSREARMSLRADEEKLLETASTLESPQAPGAAIFSCAARDFFRIVWLPRHTRDRLVVDADPFVRPLLAILDEYHRYCAVVIDRREGHLFEFYMGELLQSETSVHEGVRKRNFGGWHGLDEHRVRNHANEEAHRHYREVAKLVFEQFKKHGFELLLVGGHKETIGEFIPFLHSYVRERVAGEFVIDPATMTPAKVLEACKRLEEEYERKQEQQLVDALMEASVHERGAVLGLERTLDAANVAAISQLAIHGDSMKPGVICRPCGWLGLEGAKCPTCNRETSEVPDIIDELAEDTLNEGGEVEHVYADTPLRDHLVGALTRFPVPEL